MKFERRYQKPLVVSQFRNRGVAGSNEMAPASTQLICAYWRRRPRERRRP
jgi:hypothetical protein